MQRLANNWVYGGFLAGLLLLCLSPAICEHWSLAVTLVFLQLPVYMIHQFEEHDSDRFRLFVNRTIGGGKNVLSHNAVFVINIAGVWGFNLISILLAVFIQPGWGLIGVYLTLVNAVAHVGQAAVMKKYNPGLWTAIALFFPVGGLALWELVAAHEATALQQAIGVGSAIAFHAGIIIHVKRRKATA